MENINDEPSGARINTQDERYVKNEEEEEDSLRPKVIEECCHDVSADRYVEYGEEEKGMAPLVTPCAVEDSHSDRYVKYQEVKDLQVLIPEVTLRVVDEDVKELDVMIPEATPIGRVDLYTDRYVQYEKVQELEVKIRCSHDVSADRYIKYEETAMITEATPIAIEDPYADVKYEAVKELKDGPPVMTEDEKRMEKIKKLLMTVDTTEQRKRIVRQYLNWFKTILTSEQKKMTLETPLTDGDCEFLRVLYIPAVTGQKELNWQNLSDRREIHRYGVLFKRLFDFKDKAWDELQNILDDGR